LHALEDPWFDKHRQIATFFAKGRTSMNPAACSRPTLHGQTTAKEIVAAFMDLMRKVEDVRRRLADAAERQEIRNRILERDPIYKPKRLG